MAGESKPDLEKLFKEAERGDFAHFAAYLHAFTETNFPATRIFIIDKHAMRLSQDDADPAPKNHVATIDGKEVRYAWPTESKDDGATAFNYFDDQTESITNAIRGDFGVAFNLPHRTLQTENPTPEQMSVLRQINTRITDRLVEELRDQDLANISEFKMTLPLNPMEGHKAHDVGPSPEPLSMNHNRYHLLALDSSLCRHCEDPNTFRLTKEFPIVKDEFGGTPRLNELTRFAFAYHELAHAVTATKPWPTDEAHWLTMNDEAMSDSFQALMMIKNFGDEGVAYEQRMLRGRMASVIGRSDFQHHTAPTLLAAIEFAQQHPDFVKESPPQDIYAKAVDLARAHAFTEPEVEQLQDFMKGMKREDWTPEWVARRVEEKIAPLERLGREPNPNDPLEAFYSKPVRDFHHDWQKMEALQDGAAATLVAANPYENNPELKTWLLTRQGMLAIRIGLDQMGAATRELASQPITIPPILQPENPPETPDSQGQKPPAPPAPLSRP